jgi:hypothetical protein
VSETGGHVFSHGDQCKPSLNADLSVKRRVFLKGDIYFGFNISRVYKKKPKILRLSIRDRSQQIKKH